MFPSDRLDITGLCTAALTGRQQKTLFNDGGKLVKFSFGYQIKVKENSLISPDCTKVEPISRHVSVTDAVF